MELLRPIGWEQVSGVHVGGETVSGEQFRQIVGTDEPSVPGGASAEPDRPRVIRLHGDGSASPTAAASRSDGQATSGRAADTDGPVMGRVRSVAVDARVANWDADVEVDGLVVDVYPMDGDGGMVPVRGTLVVTLIGWRESTVLAKRGSRQIGRWSKPLWPSEFRLGGYRCRLPFRTVHPEFDLEWAAYGLLHARLGVPGQGVFETTESTVRIRPYSAVRDELELETGRRFLPLERTGRGRR